MLVCSVGDRREFPFRLGAIGARFDGRTRRDEATLL